MENTWSEVNLSVDFIKRLGLNTPGLIARSTFFYLFGAAQMILKKDFYTRRKNLEGFLIFYTLDGSGYLKYRDKNYVLTKGSIMFIDCMDYHEYYPLEDKWEVTFIHFGGATSQEYFSHIYNNHSAAILKNQEDSNSRIPQLIDEIINQMTYITLQSEVRVSLLIHQILTEILLNAMAEQGLSQKHNSSFQKVLEYIEVHSQSKIYIEDLASIMYMSVFHFSRIFKKTTGMSPHEYLIHHRINNAKSLLLYTSKSVQEIGLDVGFSTADCFIKAFKRVVGKTPKNYRK